MAMQLYCQSRVSGAVQGQAIGALVRAGLFSASELTYFLFSSSCSDESRISSLGLSTIR